jgi:tyrosine-protein phosphatase MSG5
VGSEGGLKLPLLRTVKPSTHGFAEVPLEDEEDQEPNFDIPQSREEKPAAYPNGPICIYESGVYLYYEPTAEQAADYDVILNVASEVRNPFIAPVEGDGSSELPPLEQRRVQSEPASTMDALPATDFTAATRVTGDTVTDASNTPTTPKALKPTEIPTPSQPFSIPATGGQPEYIHIPWEHNTDIVPDLYKLVRIIEDRVQKGKKVLVHCQCGVSRSASLIVAYGLYKNPHLSVQEAYNAVKKRSKWIGPNMNLIMQLQEFRNGIIKANGDRAFYNQIYGTRKPITSALTPAASRDGRRQSPFEADISTGSKTPRTAPLPPETIADIANQRASTGNMDALGTGPLTTPPTMWSATFRHSWAPSQPQFDISSQPSPFDGRTLAPYVDTKGHLVPKAELPRDGSIASHTVRVDSGTSETIGPQLKSIQQTTQDHNELDFGRDADNSPDRRVPNFSRQLVHRIENDQPVQEPSILSPRSEEFHMTALKPRSDMEDGFGILSPHSTSFNIPERPQDHIVHRDFAGLKSPGLNGGFPKNPFGPASVSRTGLDQAEPIPRTIQRPKPAPLEPSFGLMSPGLERGFPSDPFGRETSSTLQDIVSPRSSEFHMTALRPSQADTDPYGLTSPGGHEGQVSVNTFRNMAGHHQQPHVLLPQHVHPIPPPQPEMPKTPRLCLSPVTSLSIAPIIAEPSSSHSQSNAPAKHTLSAITATDIVGSPLDDTQQTSEGHLSATPRQKLRNRFSSPNMSQQRRLQKLQTAIEAKVPKLSIVGNNTGKSQDDLDALMSPRATEFTRNPFHVEVPPESAASGSTSNRNSMAFDFGWNGNAKSTEKQHPESKADSNGWTTPTKEDPRSPALKGVSPIVRNIWDVL